MSGNLLIAIALVMNHGFLTHPCPLICSGRGGVQFVDDVFSVFAEFFIICFLYLTNLVKHIFLVLVIGISCISTKRGVTRIYLYNENAIFICTTNIQFCLFYCRTLELAPQLQL